MGNNRLVLVFLCLAAFLVLFSQDLKGIGLGGLGPVPAGGQRIPRQRIPLPRSLSYSELLREGREGRLKYVVIQGHLAKGILEPGQVFTALLPEDARVSDQLAQEGVDVRVQPMQEPGLLRLMVVNWLPMALLALVWFWMMRRAGGAKGASPLGFGKSRARLHEPHGKRVTFDDVAGIDEAREPILAPAF